ncbi:uncharacterized protein B0H18DRAFT_1084095 [Fomitopsis serialis]|uniref:uncharacterized protein n=1 Tax=Fomitopsis serialis TaxID=139415 RepID=UPI0020084A83|nr:uncharacterized protein B0H18DRAFT_1084095 [Neoantrodia serialis]KAH9929753.1 hypothetical protein B0H18DRAFT_1084095 [Neoantrodia serialis]
MLSWVKALVAFVTITLNFWSFAIMFVLFAIALNYWIRFPPLLKADAQELNPDVNTPEQMPTFHNYLDEFLQAVRVFGFLEKPVFHELARHLQTRRLIAGDTLSLDEDKSFYCVIDGSVQVYARTGLPNQATGSGAWDEEDMNGYQLLNQVGSGGMLSSLFTILSLFTENVKLSWQDGDNRDDDLDSTPPRTRPRSATGGCTSPRPPSPFRRSQSPFPQSARIPSGGRPKSHVSAEPESHYSAVARAAEDSTLAVIPAEAFRRLTKKFPKATAHIVQVILTRFSRAINEIACHPLPPMFYESGLRQLRQRFDGVARTNETDSATTIQPGEKNPLTESPARRNISGHALQGCTPRQTVQAGDLHTTVGNRRSRRGLWRMTTEDFDLRDEVMSCIAKSIGLIQPPLSGADSRSTESGPFKSSFGSLSLLEIGDDTASNVTGASSILTDGYMSGLDNEVEILFFPAGSVLAKAGERNTGLFYVIDGFLDILLPTHKPPTAEGKGKGEPLDEERSPRVLSRTTSFNVPGSRENSENTRKPLFTVRPGGIAGYLSSLCQIASYVDIVAKTDTYVGSLPSPALDRLLEKRPIVLLTLAKRLISLLSPIVLHIDSSLDWMQDASDSFYIESGGISIQAEYGQGDTVGELDVITGSPRTNTVHAIRDTELIRMPRTFNPRTTAQILKMIASRVRSEIDSSKKGAVELSRSNSNLKTVAVMPVSRNVPVDAFARKLHAALESIGAPTSYLNQASVSDHLGRHAFTRMGKLKAAGWLAEQEQKYRIVLYVADSPVNSSWTQTCIRQADCVMVVGMGDDPSVGEYERLLLSLKTTARKELVLLHPDRSIAPGRPWIHQHIHVELPVRIVGSMPRTTLPQQDPAAIAAFRNLKDRVQSEIRKYRGGDFARLARRICGKSIGIVLGGGGARGISHLGVLRALEEYGIPIDMVGGTSMGAFVGGLYAREGDIISSAGRTKQFSGRMGNFWRMLSDVTYPLLRIQRYGHEFNRSIYKAFYDLHIEDMWLPYFCNSTNINTSRMEIHETGFAWRFIRASMTLVGLLPPLCDNGNMLVDGGYKPDDGSQVATMMSMGASAVIASDVGSLDDNSPRNFGDSVSGWWLLINRWNPFSNARSIPAITELQGRLAYVSSVKTLEEAKVTPGCLYMGMPVQEFGTLQFGKFEEIQESGYKAAMDFLEKWNEEGSLPSAYIGEASSSMGGKRGKMLFAVPLQADLSDDPLGARTLDSQSALTPSLQSAEPILV